MGDFLVDDDESVHSLPESEFNQPPPSLEDEEEEERKPPKHAWCEHCEEWRPEDSFSDVQRTRAKLMDRRDELTAEIARARAAIEEINDELERHARKHGIPNGESYCLLHKAWHYTGDQRDWIERIEGTAERNLDENSQAEVETPAQEELREKRARLRERGTWPHIPSTEDPEARLVPKLSPEQLEHRTPDSRKARANRNFADFLDRALRTESDVDDSVDDSDDAPAEEEAASKEAITTPRATKRHRRRIVIDDDENDGPPPSSNTTPKRRRRVVVEDDDDDWHRF